MKKIGMLFVLSSLCLLNVGCEDKAKAPTPTATVPTTTDTKMNTNTGAKSTDTKTVDPATGAKAEVKTDTTPATK